MPQSLKNLYHLFVSLLATLFYRYPARKLKVIGVTGTEGKTTTVHLIYHLLKSAGKKASMISTVKAVLGRKEYDTGFHVTTPDPWEIQKYLRQAANEGSEYMVLETTSHALDQNRVAFCRFLIGVLTNITHDHLDYHKTYPNYVAAKCKLLKMAQIPIINRDDKSYSYVMEELGGKFKRQLVTYGIRNEADFTPKKFPFKASMMGEFNEYNILAACAAVKNLGIEEEQIRKALFTFKPPEGRMEIVNRKPFLVMIDFAHTPNALEKVLFTSRFLTPKNLIAVFGCPGLRDQEKRPVMGEISARLADYTVITADDPRTENLGLIMEQMAQGCRRAGSTEGKTFWRLPDRQEAINFAIQKLAQVGDLVVVAGKGHEKSMAIGKKDYPWSDFAAVEEALAGRK